ncbi:hypothetical protein [Azospirillum agricola]|uniref:hypothetical protein n=1 Tax=Azospirillum agricola TaxID=1720247 RepID=UPI000A0F2B0A|nr:hypothetical protein [Azospirillum agricola]SMH60429.1 hypothetical protein SAMN02982994_5497 [Azospirillum lipoferum]
MEPQNILTMLGGAAIPTAGLLWFVIRMSWAAAKRDAVIDGLGKSLDALKARVDDHDDLRERLARMEQGFHDMKNTMHQVLVAVTKRASAE